MTSLSLARIVSQNHPHNGDTVTKRVEPTMPSTSMTHHAVRRLQQRGIPEDVLPLLMRFGAHQYDKRGARVVYLTHKSRQRLRKALGAEIYNQLEPALDVYAVVNRDGAVVTVGHRTHRINRS